MEYPDFLSDSAAWEKWHRANNWRYSKWFLRFTMVCAFPFWIIKLLAHEFEFCADELDRRKREARRDRTNF